jgi:hypothetical protein
MRLWRLVKFALLTLIVWQLVPLISYAGPPQCTSDCPPNLFWCKRPPGVSQCPSDCERLFTVEKVFDCCCKTDGDCCEYRSGCIGGTCVMTGYKYSQTIKQGTLYANKKCNDTKGLCE